MHLNDAHYSAYLLNCLKAPVVCNSRNYILIWRAVGVLGCFTVGGLGLQLFTGVTPGHGSEKIRTVVSTTKPPSLHVRA